MSSTLALARMRLLGFMRSQRVIGPILAAFALLGFAYAGGPSDPEQAYGFSAALLFGVYAWQAKLVLDIEPDEQRMIARSAVGSPRQEVVAGLAAVGIIAAVLACVATGIAAALGAFRFQGAEGFAGGVLVGLWAHGLAALCGSGLGVLASRTIIESVGWSAMALVGAPLLVLVLGSRRDSSASWLVPPVLRSAYADGWAAIGLVNLAALLWAAALFGAYVTLRRTRP